jgi:hypothetical protein
MTDRMPSIGSTSSRTLPLLPRTPIELVAKSIELLSQQATIGIVLAPRQGIALDQLQLPNALTDSRQLLLAEPCLGTNTLHDGVVDVVVALGCSARLAPEGTE